MNSGCCFCNIYLEDIDHLSKTKLALIMSQFTYWMTRDTIISRLVFSNRIAIQTQINVKK